MRHNDNPTTYREYAAFTNLTFHFTDRFDVQVGGRQSEIKQTNALTQTGPGATGNLPEAHAKATPFTYLVTPRFKANPDLMMYARLASGYRAGGTNVVGAGTPPQYDPDKTQNYEIGLKGGLFDRALLFDASVYYIDWKDIQLFVFNPQTVRFYNTNGSRAKSQGIELSVESKPLRGLTVASWVAWNNAELTEDLPPTSITARGVAGDALPLSSRFSAYLSLDQEFSLTDEVVCFVGGSVSYVDDRKSLFTSTGVRQVFPEYTKVDLRAGVRRNSWAADLFINNMADKRGVLGGGLGSFPPFALTFIQPRTAGISVTKIF